MDGPQDGASFGSDGGGNVVSGWSAAGIGFQYGCGIHDSKLYCWGDNTDGLAGAGSGTEPQLPPTQIGTDLWLTLASSQVHTCAIRADHTMWCWGGSGAPLLDPAAHFTPQQVPGQWSAVSMKDHLTCGLQLDGTLWCYGLDNSTAFAQRDTAASSQLATGLGHACAIHADATMWCSGLNSYGQVGSGQVGFVYDTPVQVGTEQWQSVAADIQATCGVTTGGQLRCWGREIGAPYPPPFHATPTAVLVGGEDRTDWASVSLGTSTDNACAIRSDGSAWCWGANVRRSVAPDDAARILEPTRVAGDVWKTSMPSFGEWCGIDANAELWCRGYDGWGQLGDAGTSSVVPRKVPGAFTAVAAGDQSTCAIRTDGTIGCAGSATDGALGNGLIEHSAIETITSAATWTELAGAYDSYCARASDATRWCWGAYPGIASTTAAPAPVQVQAWKVLAPGHHSCGTDSADHVSCWGFEQYGEAACSMDETVPSPVSTAATWTGLAAGWGHTCGISSAGTACWGGDFWHQLGDNATSSSCAPVPVAGGHAFVSLATGWYHTCALVADGHAWCWGHNAFGACGVGSTADVAVPAAVPTLQFSQLAAGEFHTCGIALDGAIWCWGDNTRGQLGDGTRQQRTSPVRIGNANDWQRVTAGAYHTCAVNTAHELWCWGANDRGQLADGTGWKDELIPVAAP